VHGVAFGYCTIAYIGSTFFLTYATQVGYGSTEALMFDLTLSVAIVFSAPLFGHLSDRLGRRTVMVSVPWSWRSGCSRLRAGRHEELASRCSPTA
jgi:MFS family permease